MNRRNEILHSAREYFFKFGFEETTFAQIAKDVGITQPALYVHFRNKMDLLKHVILDSAETGRQSIAKRMSTKGTALDRLLAYAEANLDFFHSEKSHAHAIRALYYFSGSSAELDQLFAQVNQVAIANIRSLVSEILREKDSGSKVSSSHLGPREQEDVAIAIHSLLVGDCYRAGTTNSRSQLEKVRDQNRRAVQCLLKGLSSTKSKRVRK